MAGEDLNDSGDLDIDKSLSLQGAGPGQTRILGGTVNRVLHVQGGAGVTVAMSGLTVAGGRVTGSGGGILLEADTTLLLQNVEITGNLAAATVPSNEGGGGINNQGGHLTLAHATLHGNRTTVRTGGGLRNAGSDSSILLNVTISGNQADSSGGGLAAISGPVTLNNVTVTGNDPNHDGINDVSNGGGLRVVDNASTRVRLQNSILAGNTRGDGATPTTAPSRAPGPSCPWGRTSSRPSAGAEPWCPCSRRLDRRRQGTGSPAGCAGRQR